MATANDEMPEHQEKVQVESQPTTEHVEGDLSFKHQHDVLLKSSLDDLGLWATVKRFKKVRCYSTLRCLTGC
jgi:hypothetical protein